MNQIWTEERIRNEIIKLDEKTGLNGRSLAINFNNSNTFLGLFYHANEKNEPRFAFSNSFFQDPDWPEEMAREVIIHEYAHYMESVLYGRSGHGQTWKTCCRKLGIRPRRVYDLDREAYVRATKILEERKSRKLDKYYAGHSIEHPRYGIGQIKEISGFGSNRTVKVEFPGIEMKTLSLSWIDANCKHIKAEPFE